MRQQGPSTLHHNILMSGYLSRPALRRCLKKLESGDTLMVWKLDRLGRSLRDLIAMLDDLKQRGVKFGRKPKLTAQKIAHAQKLIEDGQRRKDVADLFKVNRVTLYRALAD